jgi:hypothetical protein
MDEEACWSMMKNIFASFLFLPIAFIRVEIIDFLNWFLFGWAILVMTVIYRKLPEETMDINMSPIVGYHFSMVFFVQSTL